MPVNYNKLVHIFQPVVALKAHDQCEKQEKKLEQKWLSDITYTTICLTSVIHASKSDVLPENANWLTVSHYFKREKLHVTMSTQNPQPVL